MLRNPRKKSIKILGKIYITPQGASERYGLPIRWFESQRRKKLPPLYFRLTDRGRILYDQEEADKWFKENLKIYNNIEENFGCIDPGTETKLGDELIYLDNTGKVRTIK